MPRLRTGGRRSHCSSNPFVPPVPAKLCTRDRRNDCSFEVELGEAFKRASSKPMGRDKCGSLLRDGVQHSTAPSGRRKRGSHYATPGCQLQVHCNAGGGCAAPRCQPAAQPALRRLLSAPKQRPLPAVLLAQAHICRLPVCSAWLLTAPDWLGATATQHHCRTAHLSFSSAASSASALARRRLRCDSAGRAKGHGKMGVLVVATPRN